MPRKLEKKKKIKNFRFAGLQTCPAVLPFMKKRSLLLTFAGERS